VLFFVFLDENGKHFGEHLLFVRRLVCLDQFIKIHENLRHLFEIRIVLDHARQRFAERAPIDLRVKRSGD
jgi:hypothetical protein